MRNRKREVEPPRRTDSVWFWVYLFSTAALVALFLMDEKYLHRQTHIEDEFRYGTRTLEKPTGTAASEAAAQNTAPARDNSPERAPLTGGQQPQTHEMLISLWPLRVVAGLVMLASWAGMQWDFARRRRAFISTTARTAGANSP